MSAQPVSIWIRADASVGTGTGHVMRCLTLAHELREKGAHVRFLSRLFPGNLCDFVSDQGFDVVRLPWQESDVEPWLGVTWQEDAQQVLDVLRAEGQPVDWLIVDHYGLDARWERQVRGGVRRLMAIDDTADRPHECDLLLDQNLHEQSEARYRHLVPSSCETLFGPHFALLRPEFRETRKQVSVRQRGIKKILVFFGGTDPTRETEKAVEALASLQPADWTFDVIVGGTNPQRERMEQLVAGTSNAAFYCQVSDMAAKMAAADLSIGAGGSATWERCCLGLPSLQIVVADNQREIAENVARVGASVTLGEAVEVTADRIRAGVERFLTRPETLAEMSRRAMKLVDGEGAARVGERLLACAEREERA
ncbi:UDP-2,4-diacetamido-2,4,6-trideoxy-beta-L-altropyranose hydrolase [Tumebacillus sp. ITR2]|uniref:UDP-2,4-diacetamido-2,4, 6-trideoxy-beta-L-altropyranose hydrolase n=1 Tax=Tumebacillus amylolyticus TaxID=2801339 RepID=A0ABS1J5K3_9BACL|nr:UDP-2,4-diacetamido-2,4,6-trideoxy-beta-L-altropyranose hydrolase [Tumebacillus amylolyticus]MBL0385526.1 UDP-2,4-diacetamido-2,4,6-trideoxy-beta-L-altropyranose hydrolase [Tumebacillus amylolyticus]